MLAQQGEDLGAFQVVDANVQKRSFWRLTPAPSTARNGLGMTQLPDSLLLAQRLVAPEKHRTMLRNDFEDGGRTVGVLYEKPVLPAWIVDGEPMPSIAEIDPNLRDVIGEVSGDLGAG